MISISLDSDDPKILEESRRIPTFMLDIEEAVKRIKRTKIKSMASILIWNNNHDRMEQLFVKATDMGFDLISVKFPDLLEVSFIPSGRRRDQPVEKLGNQSLESMIEIKKRHGIRSSTPPPRWKISSSTSQTIQRCAMSAWAGSRVMFVDWFANVRPCMQLPQVLGNILTMTKDDFATASCNQCNMSWYRDFSTFFHGVKSLPVYWNRQLPRRVVPTGAMNWPRDPVSGVFPSFALWYQACAASAAWAARLKMYNVLSIALEIMRPAASTGHAAILLGWR